MHNVNRIEFAYDGFGRVTNRTYSNTSGANRRVTTYTYQDVGTDKTTTLLKSVNNSGFGELGYEYDAVGNITQITKNGAVQETYTYDDLNQLKTVTRNGVTTEYNYQNGNITSVTQNGTVIKTYGYTDSTWSDLLTSFNGQTITYDEIGNPLQYRDGLSFTWAKGRQLQSVTKDGLTASYTYDENGLRLSKTVNGVTTNIFRTNGQMVGMNSSDGKDMTFMLDGNGNVYGVHYDHYSSNQPKSETYYFAFNAQGDVIGIYEFSGRLMASYDYDEWGNCTVNVLAADNNGHAVDSPDHIAYANPFRYRGYFYDAETELYYLNSRYYMPVLCRFLNGDGIAGINQDMNAYNLFAYCSNNPVNYCDPSGCYTITYPAEGDGPVTVGRYPWEPEISVEKVGNTYTATPSSNIPGVATNIAGLAGISIGDELIKSYLNGIYVAEKEVVYRTAGNIVLRTFVPKHPSLVRAQTYSKTVGVVSTLAFVYDMAVNFKTYGGFTKDFGKAAVVTTTMTVIGIGVGVGIACLNIPAVAGVALAVGVGYLLSVGEDYWKTSWIGY